MITVSILFYQYYSKRHNDDMFYNAGETIKSLGLENCRIGSPQWVPVNYYTGDIFYLWKTLNQSVDSNEIALIFPCCSTTDDTFKMEDVNKYPFLFKTDEFILIAKKNLTNKSCVKREGWSSPMVSDPCDVLSKRFKKFGIDKPLLKICYLINKKQ